MAFSCRSKGGITAPLFSLVNQMMRLTNKNRTSQTNRRLPWLTILVPQKLVCPVFLLTNVPFLFSFYSSSHANCVSISFYSCSYFFCLQFQFYHKRHASFPPFLLLLLLCRESNILYWLWFYDHVVTILPTSHNKMHSCRSTEQTTTHLELRRLPANRVQLALESSKRDHATRRVERKSGFMNEISFTGSR